MNRTWLIEVVGLPVPKGRPRFTKKGAAFTPRKTRHWENVARLYAQQQMKGQPPTLNPVQVTVTAVFPILGSWPLWKREAAEAGRVGHTSTPDADNIAKAATDACNSVVYKDDSQIVQMVSCKRYGQRPRVEIEIRELDLIPAQQKRRDAA